MNIYIDITELKDGTGKTLAALPKVDINVGIDEGYDISRLGKLKESLQEVLDNQLPKCVEHHWDEIKIYFDTSKGDK